MTIKITQSFTDGGIAMPCGVVVTVSDEQARQLISEGLAVPIPSLEQRETAVRDRRRAAVTQKPSE